MKFDCDVDPKLDSPSRRFCRVVAPFVTQSATVARTLGRPLAGGASSVTVNLIAPQTVFGDRINQVDFRVAKVLRFGRSRTQIGIDIDNVMNSNVAQGYLQTFGPTWLRRPR
jgi:hypothetical protein